MVNKISRLQRWLDRLGAACDSKHWDAAVVEADCLSAEVREVRDELWKLAMEEPSAAGRIFSREGVAMSFKSVVIAMLIVMFSTLPIAVESEKPWSQAGCKINREPPLEGIAQQGQDCGEFVAAAQDIGGPRVARPIRAWVCHPEQAADDNSKGDRAKQIGGQEQKREYWRKANAKRRNTK